MLQLNGVEDMKKKLLFVTYGGGHVNAIMPVVEVVQREGLFEYEILALTSAAKVLEASNFKYLQLKDFSDDQVVELGLPLANKYHNDGVGISIEETVAYYGSGMRDLILEYGCEKAKVLFEEHGRKAFLPVNTMKKVIKETRADMVICTSSPRAEKAALIAARSLSLPALRIEQLFYAKDLDLPDGVCFAVLNNMVKKKLISGGIKSELIFITGQPAFDKIRDKKLNTHQIKDFKAKLGLQESQKVIMWVSPGNKDQTKILNKLLEIEKKNNDVTLIIKLHPNETGHYQRGVVAKANSRALVISSYLHELISISDLVITEFSAVGMEAILLDRPLLIANIENVPNHVHYAESGAAIEVNSIDDLEKEVHSILNNIEVQSNLEHFRESFKNDGFAATRVYEVIKQNLR